MDWFILAVVSSLLGAVNSVIIKILLEKDKRFCKPFPYAMLLTFVDTVLVLGVYIAFPISFAMPQAFYSFVIGCVVSYAFYFFFHAMKNDEGSRAIALMQTGPLMVATMSALFLGEILGLRQYAGIVLIVSASILASHKKTKSGGRQRSPALKYALAYALIIAIADVSMKYLLGDFDFWSFFFWSSIGVVANILAWFAVPSIRRDFVTMAKSLDGKTVGMLVGKEVLWFFAQMAFIVAVSQGPVSIVSAVSALQPMFVLAIATGMSMFIPHILSEDIAHEHMREKLLAVLLVFFGVWLLNA
jgi:drug/metabolite transporter (DMT)-like permease